MKSNINQELINDYINKIEDLEYKLKQKINIISNDDRKITENTEDSIKILNNINKEICEKLDQINVDSDTPISKKDLMEFKMNIKKANKLNKKPKETTVVVDLLKVIKIIVKELSYNIIYKPMIFILIILISLTTYYLSNNNNISLLKIFNTIKNSKKF
jgi:hypothetical protein